MVRALDAGPCITSAALLDAQSTLPWLHDTMAEESALALEDFYAITSTPHPANRIRPGDPLGETQYADGQLIICGRDSIDRQMRAYEPAPGCWTIARWPARAHPWRRAANGDARLCSQAKWLQGETVYWAGCGEGAVAITKLQPPGKRSMDAAANLNGNSHPERFGRQ